MRRPPQESSPPALDEPGSPGLGEADRQLFEAEMGGVRPLGPRARQSARLAAVDAVAAPRTIRIPAPPVRLTPLNPEAIAGEGAGYRANDVPLAALRELRQGGRRPEATLDLHGRTGPEADAALSAFVGKAVREGQRVLLVVHGRGRGSGAAGPVLGARVLALVTDGRLAARMLAVVPAPAALGGAGATLLWLRREG